MTGHDVVTVTADDVAQALSTVERRAMDSALDLHGEALLAALNRYMETHPGGAGVVESNLPATYTASADYLRYVAGFQHHPSKQRALSAVWNRYGPDTAALDLGCNAGFTGLALRLNGWERVDFADFEGLGLGFVRWFCKEHGWDASIYTFVADGTTPVWPRYDVVLAFDVIEHTPNQLAFLEWCRRLGKVVALTWPTVSWFPPLYQAIDTFIDHEAMLWVIERRFNVLEAWFEDNRQFVLFETGGD